MSSGQKQVGDWALRTELDRPLKVRYGWGELTLKVLYRAVRCFNIGRERIGGCGMLDYGFGLL